MEQSKIIDKLETYQHVRVIAALFGKCVPNNVDLVGGPEASIEVRCVFPLGVGIVDYPWITTHKFYAGT